MVLYSTKRGSLACNHRGTTLSAISYGLLLSLSYYLSLSLSNGAM